MNPRTYVPLIWTFSIAVPVVVGILLTPGLIPRLELGFSPYILAKLNATINGTVSVLLLAGYLLIRAGKRDLHKMAMLGAFGLSALFLVSYVLYHLSVGHTPYCEDGLVPRNVYFFVLLSHILLSVTIIPLASFSIYRALSERFDPHKKLARITFPLWLYVSVTGVLVYLFIAPCHPV
jgi:putative membrane protein